METDPRAVSYLALLTLAAILALIVVILVWQSERRRLEARIRDARKESVDRARSTLKGQIAEQLLPLLPGFRYRPADARFLGDPVDYIVFNGYTGLRDEGADARELEIVLLEVKQGGSSLTPFQRSIARSVEEGKVRFEICRVQDDGSVAAQTWRPRRAG
jgi:predicted Holliday junction resolvase-like endonuclease